MRKRWSEEEDICIREHYQEKGARWVAERLGRGPHAIRSRARRIGVSGPAPRGWTKKEDEKVISMRKAGVSARDIAQKLGRSVWAIERRVRVLGVKLTEDQRRMRNAETAAKRAGPMKSLPPGTLRVYKGALFIRVDSAGGKAHERWCSYPKWLWLQGGRKIPPGMVVVFKPGRRTTDPQKITVDDLELVSKAELIARYSPLIDAPPEIAGLYGLIGSLKKKIRQREKQMQSEES